ncbi:hypothetical protein HKX48_007588 [Thoreauomyces humboldtii]|nr:hypothetical protein HKX48_007588 [Thoreauomyces humboldtii]
MSDTVAYDSSIQAMAKKTKHKNIHVMDEVSNASIAAIVATQKQQCDAGKKELLLLVIDDSGDAANSKELNKELSKLYTKGRHSLCSIMVAIQSISGQLTRKMKGCTTEWIIFKNSADDMNPEHQTQQKPLKPASIAPLQITSPRYWQCDLISMRSYPDGGYTCFFHMIDGFTKLSSGRPLRTETEQETTAALKSCIEEVKGKGAKISVMQLDLGSHFQSVFRAMLTSFGIKQVYSQAARPQSNAFVERRGGQIKQQLYQFMEAHGNKKLVAYFQIVIGNVNSTISLATGFAPNALEKATPEQQAQAAAKIKGTVQQRFKSVVISAPLNIGQQVRFKRILQTSIKKPGLLGYWSKPIYTVTERLNSTYTNILPSYRIADAAGRVQYGRYPATSLLNVPPILSKDVVSLSSTEDQGSGPQASTEEMESHLVEDVTLPADAEPVTPDPVGNDLVQDDTDSVMAPPRRSLRLRPGPQEYEADFIFAKRGKGRTLQYLVNWVGYGPEAANWQSVKDLANAKDLISEFLANETSSGARV